jgi:hypothetical protein
VSTKRVTVPAEDRATTMTLQRRATTMTFCNTNSRSGHSSPSVTGDVTITAGRQIVRAKVVHIYGCTEKLVLYFIYSVFPLCSLFKEDKMADDFVDSSV